jgi:DUF4097 and DUF4098 domain-containing protein YvlB
MVMAYLSLLLHFSLGGVRAAEVSDEIDRDFLLRSVGQFQVSNTRGSVEVRGWALDKIRVKARRKADGETEEEARKQLVQSDVRFRPADGQLVLSAEYGKGLELQDLMKERTQPHARMDIVVFAPSHLRLRVWTNAGGVRVKSWSSAVDVRASSGDIEVENISGDAVTVQCPECNIRLKAVRASVRVAGGVGSLDLNDVSGADIYAETSSGPLKISKAQGEQLYVSKSGAIHGHDLNGHVEFHSRDGLVDISDASGFISGQTDSGDISARVRSWRFRDKGLIETRKGNVTLVLPANFSGDLDARSVFGSAESEFSIRKTEEQQAYGPEPASHLLGRIGEGGEVLRVHSDRGNIRILKRK